MAVGGAAYLVSKAMRAATVVAFPELGMEAIYEFEVKDMPVTVAVGARGTSAHQTGPREWQKKSARLESPPRSAELCLFTVAPRSRTPTEGGGHTSGVRDEYRCTHSSR